MAEGLGEHLLRLEQLARRALLVGQVTRHTDDALDGSVLVTHRNQRGLEHHVRLQRGRSLFVALRLTRLDAATVVSLDPPGLRRRHDLGQAAPTHGLARQADPFGGLSIEGLEHERRPGQDLDQEDSVGQMLEDRLQLLERVVVAGSEPLGRGHDRYTLL